MRRLARWHIWLGWLVGVPMLLWTLSGVLMVVRPIEDVRGTHLRLNPEQRPALTITPAQITAGPGQTISELRSFMQHGRAITLATAPDGRITRYDAATGAALPPLDEAEARVVLRSAVRGGDQVTIIRAFDPRNPPLDLRKPVAVWQATLADGTRVYINRDSGEIEAVRTRWWRFYDFMWGIHIMDLQTREDSHNPFVIVFGLLALVASIMGVVLLFRRRRSRVAA